MRPTAPAWHDAVNAGKESVVCDLKTEAGLALANALCARADVVLDGFRPGVLDRLGRASCPRRAVLCVDHRLRRRATGTSCAPATTSTTSAGQACSPTPRPAMPPTQVADLAAGGLSRRARGGRRAARARAHRPRRAAIVVSMTHGSHRLVAHRLERPARAPADRRARLLPDLRDRRRPLADGRRARAEVLAAALRGRRAGRSSPSASSIPTRRRSRPSSPRRSPRDRWRSGSSCSTARTCAPGPVWTIEEAAAEFGVRARRCACPRARRAHRRLARRVRAVDAFGHGGADAGRKRAVQIPPTGRAPRAAPTGRAVLRRPAAGLRGRSGTPASRARPRPRCRPRPSRRPSPPRAGATSSRSSAPRKIDSCGLVQPWARDAIAQSTSSRWWATKSEISRPPFETRPSFSPWRAQLVRARAGRRRRGRSSPSAPRPASSRPRGRGLRRLAAHPADDPLGEGEPELLVVAELRVTLERVDRGGAGLRVPRRVEVEPVALAQPPVALGPEIGPGLASVKSTSKRTARRVTTRFTWCR